MKTKPQGAGTPVYLASSPEVDGITGPILRQPQTEDLQQGLLLHLSRRRLWQASADLAGLKATA